jgi:integrase
MNIYLKEIGKIAELTDKQRIVYYIRDQRHEEIYEKWQLLTTHCARRTFVCLSIALGTHTKVIMSNTGHKDYKSIKPYEKVMNEVKKVEMTKFDNLPINLPTFSANQ